MCCRISRPVVATCALAQHGEHRFYRVPDRAGGTFEAVALHLVRLA